MLKVLDKKFKAFIYLNSEELLAYSLILLHFLLIIAYYYEQCVNAMER